MVSTIHLKTGWYFKGISLLAIAIISSARVCSPDAMSDSDCTFSDHGEVQTEEHTVSLLQTSLALEHDSSAEEVTQTSSTEAPRWMMLTGIVMANALIVFAMVIPRHEDETPERYRNAYPCANSHEQPAMGPHAQSHLWRVQGQLWRKQGTSPQYVTYDSSVAADGMSFEYGSSAYHFASSLPVGDETSARPMANCNVHEVRSTQYATESSSSGVADQLASARITVNCSEEEGVSVTPPSPDLCSFRATQPFVVYPASGDAPVGPVIVLTRPPEDCSYKRPSLGDECQDAIHSSGAFREQIQQDILSAQRHRLAERVDYAIWSTPLPSSPMPPSPRKAESIAVESNLP